MFSVRKDENGLLKVASMGKELFFVDHFPGHSPVYHDVLSVDKIVFGSTEKKAGIGNIFRMAHPSGRVLGMVNGFKLVIGFILYPSGTDTINCDLIVGQKDGQGMGKGDNPPLWKPHSLQKRVHFAGNG